MSDPTNAPTDFLARFDALPLGAFEGRAEGKKWSVSRTQSAGGLSQKLFARALDGSDHVSLNLYRLDASAALRPCEMPAERVIRFVMDLRPERADQ